MGSARAALFRSQFRVQLIEIQVFAAVFAELQNDISEILLFYLLLDPLIPIPFPFHSSPPSLIGLMTHKDYRQLGYFSKTQNVRLG